VLLLHDGDLFFQRPPRGTIAPYGFH
jgi:hypothetical protein